jgi:S-DNA-T family DNA segregation ATPase FtsK/SpoIIIE
MALRYIAGLALAALGVMIFMAVDLNMSGNIFQGLRQVCFGISGSLAYILAVLPLWAGGLVIWSAQRRAPVRPWVFALLSFIGICTFIMLISGNALDSLDRRSGGQFGNVLQNVYSDCMRTGTGGGVLGTLLGWPLWRFLGTILGVVIIFLGTLFCLLMAMNLTPSRLRDLFTGQYSAHREQQKQERMYAEQQQMAWQQQQYAQQQAWQQHLMEQQQQQQYAQQQNMQQPAAPQYPPQNMPQGMQAGQQSVAQWQDQMTAAQTAAAAPGHQSSIFGGRNTAQPEKPARNWKSRIFGKKEEEYDGLVGDDTVPAEPVQPPRKTTGRRTATGAEAAPVTEWNLPDREAEAARKRQAAQPAVTEPAEEAPEAKIPKSVNRDSYKRPADRRPVREEVEEPAEEVRPARRRPAAAPEAPAPKVKAPAVQQEMSRETWSPELNLKPSEKVPNTPEESEWIPRAYNYPPITDLAMPKPSVGDTGAEDAMRSRKLEETLASFRVQAQVVHVTHGPAVSRFELELAPGTKVNKVAELEKDIAYGMEATSVRIEAPIPGKSLVGVEVPNRQIETVTLREVLSSERMQNAKSILTVALGKDIAGTPIVCDLSKMPHLLIAGQTGSGKSVCINAIINSLLYRASPDEVKLILVDPKVVELQCYNGIPHLLIPVVNDPRKAAAALAWAVAEMLERYDRFAEKKVRNLDGYNSVLKDGEKPMSRIVIIIDELADLMMVCKKDVEEYICRLTQLARAAGIHLIVATQRPSVDVITGLIKANIPSRIAFKTASSVDSRTILDRNGSEQLLGWGDMLYLPTGSFAPTRVQGCFLSDEEVNKIVDHVRRANPATYDPDILEKLEQLAGGSAGDMSGADMVGGTGELGEGDGGLFEQAVEFAISDGQISTSSLQRRLKIGYARAGRLTDEMEERGIIAAKDGSKPRKCLITREEWEALKQQI